MFDKSTKIIFNQKKENRQKKKLSFFTQQMNQKILKQIKSRNPNAAKYNANLNVIKRTRSEIFKLPSNHKYQYRERNSVRFSKAQASDFISKHKNTKSAKKAVFSRTLRVYKKVKHLEILKESEREWYKNDNFTSIV